MKKSCSCEDHGELTCIVGVIEPVSRVTDIIRMKSSRESNHSVTSFSPNTSGQPQHLQTMSQGVLLYIVMCNSPKGKLYFIMSKMNIIINGEDCVSLYGREWKETVV